MRISFSYSYLKLLLLVLISNPFSKYLPFFLSFSISFIFSFLQFQLDLERKLFSEEKLQKEKKIRDLEEEIFRYKLNSPMVNKNVGKDLLKTETVVSNIYSPNYNQTHKTDTFNLLYSVPHNFFSFLFPSSTHVMQAPVVNV